MRSTRSKACDISAKVRKQVKERDKWCVVCGGTYGLEIAHIFINRSSGGLGVKENLALLCKKHHMDLDSGKYRDSYAIRQEVEAYLKGLYEINIKKLKYNKWG